MNEKNRRTPASFPTPAVPKCCRYVPDSGRFHSIPGNKTILFCRHGALVFTLPLLLRSTGKVLTTFIGLFRLSRPDNRMKWGRLPITWIVTSHPGADQHTAYSRRHLTLLQSGQILHVPDDRSGRPGSIYTRVGRKRQRKPSWRTTNQNGTKCNIKIIYIEKPAGYYYRKMVNFVPLQVGRYLLRKKRSKNAGLRIQPETVGLNYLSLILLEKWGRELHWGLGWRSQATLDRQEPAIGVRMVNSAPPSTFLASMLPFILRSMIIFDMYRPIPVPLSLVEK